MKTSFAALIPIFLYSAIAVGAEGPSLDAGEYRTLIVEHVRVYAVQKYSPPFGLTRVTRDAARYDKPEDTLAAYFSSMQSGDFDWNNETWTCLLYTSRCV